MYTTNRLWISLEFSTALKVKIIIFCFVDSLETHWIGFHDPPSGHGPLGNTVVADKSMFFNTRSCFWHAWKIKIRRKNPRCSHFVTVAGSYTWRRRSSGNGGWTRPRTRRTPSKTSWRPDGWSSSAARGAWTTRPPPTTCPSSTSLPGDWGKTAAEHLHANTRLSPDGVSPGGGNGGKYTPCRRAERLSDVLPCWTRIIRVSDEFKLPPLDDFWIHRRGRIL